VQSRRLREGDVVEMLLIILPQGKQQTAMAASVRRLTDDSQAAANQSDCRHETG
jgi:hypothetical protein